MKRVCASMAALLLAGLFSACGGGSSISSGPKPSPSPSPSPAGLTITTKSLSGAIAGVPFGTTLGAEGGTKPYKWDAPRGLEQGWSLTEAGVLSGTRPLSYGGDCCFPITVRVSDSGNPSASVTEIITLSIFGVLPISTELGTGRAGLQFEQTFIASGGKAPITWAPSGTVPPGLIFGADFADPVRKYDLVGKPTQPGSYEFSITVTDSSSPRLSQTMNYQVQVLPSFLRLPHAILPPGVVGQGYDYTFSPSGGAPPYSWSINSAEVPAGLRFDTATGRMFGTPTAAGYMPFGLGLTDSSPPYPQYAQQSYWVLVTPQALPPRNDSIADATPIFLGTYEASISPYTDPSGSTGPDEDYYQLTASAGATLTVRLQAGPSGLPTLQPVVEIVNAYGQRHVTCSDPYDDYLPPDVPVPQDPTPAQFDDPCMNHIENPFVQPQGSAELYFQVPGDSGDVTFYIHVFDFRGDARPDMFYTLYVYVQ
jgi:hypothetical protein